MALDKFKRGCPYGAEVAAEVEAGGEHGHRNKACRSRNKTGGGSCG